MREESICDWPCTTKCKTKRKLLISIKNKKKSFSGLLPVLTLLKNKLTMILCGVAGCPVTNWYLGYNKVMLRFAC